ncbi:MAG: DsbE family thiol:disulfide interchange protein [Gammaproteobacteria bacterium]|nr:DsbE family thiol:disulfide interchange protein [Gammaproteobacteria bacterium]
MNRFMIPLFGFVALVVLLAVGLRLNPHEVPSPLIDKQAPAFSVPQLRDPQVQLSDRSLLGKVTLLNVWASWCGGCRHEHPLLVELAARHKLPIYGLDYKDESTNALAWLTQNGDPYTAIGFDALGKVGLDYGVYGVPETYLLDRHGVIRYKHTGPLSRDVLEDTLLPLIERLEHEPA